MHSNGGPQENLNRALSEVLVSAPKVVTKNQPAAPLWKIDNHEPEEQANQVADRQVEYDGISVMQRQKRMLDGCSAQEPDNRFVASRKSAEHGYQCEPKKCGLHLLLSANVSAGSRNVDAQL